MHLLKVLIADEDVLLLSAYRTFLAGENIELTTTVSAEVCQAIFRLQPPDIFVVDPAMPGINVNDLLADLDQRGPGTKLPLMILTARPDELPGEVLTRPRVTLLFKPVSPSLLARMVNACAVSNEPALVCVEP